MKQLFISILFAAISITVKGQNLKIFADSIRETSQIPEIGFAIVTADTVLELYTLGYHKTGTKNEENKAKTTDLFHLGSNTKAFTGFIAGYLVEEGKINWTTKFFDLFPDWKKGSDSAYYQVTLADLLSHRARVQPYTSGLAYQKLPQYKGTKAEQRKSFAKHVLQEAPVKSTEKSVDYSNAGYTVAALMLEKVSGKTWEQLVDEVFLEKLQLDYSFGWPNLKDADQPWGHWIEADTLRALPATVKYNLNLGEPAGDISMSLPDYAKFIQLNMQGLAGRDNLLDADTYNFLHDGFKDYSIGWSNVNTANRQLSEHAGSAGTFFCYTLIDRRKGLGYIIVANSATEDAQQGVFRMLDKIREKYGR